MIEEFHKSYHEAEEKFRTEASRLHSRNEDLQASIRRNVDAPDEAREAVYIEGYQGISEDFDKLANDFARSVERDRSALERTVYEGTGEKFSDHLTRLAGVPDGQLETLMRTARRSGQKDMERAVAITSLERQGHSPLFEDWAQTDPQTAEALQKLRGLPDLDRLRTRTLAMRPFKAHPEALTPRQEDREREAAKAAADEASKAAFFNRPRRQAGRRVS